MEDIKLTMDDLSRYIIYLNIALGILFGTLPLIAGLILKNVRFAIISFIVTAIGGGLLGVFLCYPLAVIFLFLIVRRGQNAVEKLPDANTFHEMPNN